MELEDQLINDLLTDLHRKIWSNEQPSYKNFIRYTELMEDFEKRGYNVERHKRFVEIYKQYFAVKNPKNEED